MATQGGSFSGLLNVNKPGGMTSHDVVARIRKISGQRKVGHTGTLDPLATGVLLVCLGQATRLIEYVQGSTKQYRATIRFGITTDTLDAEGQIHSKTDPSGLTKRQLQQILPEFQGEIEQIPPIFSALKQGGQPLYKLARAGQPVAVQPRRVTIHSISLLTWHPPDLTLDVVCSAGTYIRALARDLGAAASTGAHLAELTRTGNGRWRLSEAVSLEELEQSNQTGRAPWQKYLQPLDSMVAHLPEVILNEAAANHVQHGRPVIVQPVDRAAPTEPSLGLCRAYTPEGEFFAILTRVESDDKLWRPKKVFHPQGG